MTQLFEQPVQPVVVLNVNGDPQPEGNKTGYVDKRGRVHLVEGRRGPARKAFAAWRKDLVDAAERAMRLHHADQFTGPVRVRIIFRLTRPKSVKSSKRWWPTVPPDADKLARAVLDGLKPCWTDDAQVCELVVRKRYATDDEQSGAHITIEPLTTPEATL